MVLTIISKAGLFCLQVRRHMHHITPICDYEKTSEDWAGGGGAIVSVPKFQSQFSFSDFVFLRLKKYWETVIRYLRDWNTVR